MADNQSDNNQNGKSFKSVVALLSGNSVATVIGFLIYPLLTRIYTSEDFGTFGIFTSTCGVLTLLANAEYHNAIMLPKEREDSAACFHLSFLSTAALSILILIATVFIYLFSDSDFNPMEETLLIVAPYVFICALWNALNAWYTKITEFNKVALYQTTQASSLAFFKLLFGYISLPFEGMSLASIVGQATAMLHNLLTSTPKIKPLLSFDWERCKACAVRYAKFPMLTLPRSFVGFVSNNLPFFLLPFFFLKEDLGFFSLAIALAFRPINILSTSLYQVFFPKSAKSVNQGERLIPFFKKFSVTTISIAIPSLTLIYFLTPTMVDLILGEGWEETSLFVRMMLPWLATSLLVAPICYFTDLFLRQSVGLGLEVIHFLARLASLCYGIYVNDFRVAIGLYCLANAVMILVNYVWLYYIVKKHDESLSSEYKKAK